MASRGPRLKRHPCPPNRDGRDTSAFTRVCDALCPAMTAETGPISVEHGLVPARMRRPGERSPREEGRGLRDLNLSLSQQTPSPIPHYPRAIDRGRRNPQDECVRSANAVDRRHSHRRWQMRFVLVPMRRWTTSPGTRPAGAVERQTPLRSARAVAVSRCRRNSSALLLEDAGGEPLDSERRRARGPVAAPPTTRRAHRGLNGTGGRRQPE
jgi:hypothetical protein